MPYKDPEVAKQKAKERYYGNKELRLKQAKEYYWKNRERIRKWRKENIDYKEKYWKNRESFLRDHKKYYTSEKGKETRRNYEREQYHNEPQFLKKKKARDIAKYIPKKDCCEKCSSKKELHNHHPDYDRPREVITLCKICHGLEHGKRFN